MAFLGSTLGKLFAGGKSPRRNRGAPSRKQVRRLAVEDLEPRMVLSANAVSIGSAYNLDTSAAPALLAGTNQSKIAGLPSLPFVVPARPPATPPLSATAPSGTQIELSWRTMPRASGYVVEQWIDSAWSQIGSFGSRVTSDTVSSLSPGATYTFRVGASGSAGTSWSRSRSVLLSLPAAPSFTAAPVSETQINLSWSTVSGASGYLVEEWINNAWSQIGSFGSGVTGDAVRGLSPGAAYTFRVGAYNAVGTSWASSQSVATVAAIDHPAAATAYTPVSGSLFASGGPSYSDVQQGDVGDCWLMASLAEVAARDPQDIKNMFTSDGTTVENGATVNLYTVHLFGLTNNAQPGSSTNNALVPVSVVVDTELPVWNVNSQLYAHVVNGVEWAALAEKAYWQAANEWGYLTVADSPVGDAYPPAGRGGDAKFALQAITGHWSNDISGNIPTSAASAWTSGQLVTLGTSTPASSYIVGDHCYALVGYNPSSSQPFQIYNP
ncbi:MAG: fibronectin type III domain-containing protein, partial [Thermoguttaceae bacterium]